MRPISALVAVFCFAAAALAQNPCSDPRQRAGACIPLFNCNSLVTILRNRPVSPENKAFLAKTQCGWQDPQPLVCCTDGIPQTSVPNAGANPPRAGSGLLPVPGSGECGVDTSERIYGGEATKIDEFPWLVLLEYSKPQGKKGFHCGGVLISPRYVLTASHCVNSAELPKTWTLSGVRLGEWDLETEQDCDNSGGSPDCVQEPVQDIPIEKKIPHERYEPAGEQQYNDIALIKLAYPARLSYYVKPICLPSDPSLKDNNVVGDTFQVAGWGKTEKRSQSNIKLKVGVNGTSYDTCNQVYQSTRRVINSSQLCAGGEKGKDSCRGDSGGPLMGQFKSRGKAYTYLAGLVSYGPSPCGQEGWPGVYTRVSQYIDWINSKIEP